jgi:hypothetical protein
MSGVFQNMDPPPPHRPASVYPPPPGAGGGHTRSVLYIRKYLVTLHCLHPLPTSNPSIHCLLILPPSPATHTRFYVHLPLPFPFPVEGICRKTTLLYLVPYFLTEGFGGGGRGEPSQPAVPPPSPSIYLPLYPPCQDELWSWGG